MIQRSWPAAYPRTSRSSSPVAMPTSKSPVPRSSMFSPAWPKLGRTPTLCASAALTTYSKKTPATARPATPHHSRSQVSCKQHYANSLTGTCDARRSRRPTREESRHRRTATGNRARSRNSGGRTTPIVALPLLLCCRHAHLVAAGICPAERGKRARTSLGVSWFSANRPGPHRCPSSRRLRPSSPLAASRSASPSSPTGLSARRFCFAGSTARRRSTFTGVRAVQVSGRG